MKLSLIIPTWNERENLPLLAERVHMALVNQDYELIVVDDDSADGTGEVAEQLRGKYPIRVLHRKNKKGLSSAIIDGLELADGDKVIVMDADLQHPPELLPDLLQQLETHHVVVASRHCKGGGIEGWTLKRKFISIVANLLAFPLVPNVNDRTSGYFGFSRDILTGASLNGRGFKIMLEVLVRGKGREVTEVPLTFVDRRYGKSKFSLKQVKDYLIQLVALYFHKYGTFAKFCAVGASGVLIHFAVLYSFTEFIGLHYLLSAVIAVLMASTNNYILNHMWSFRDRMAAVKNRFIGWLKFISTSAIIDGIYISLLALFVEIVGLWFILAAFISLLITTPLRFIIVSRWIWKK